MGIRSAGRSSAAISAYVWLVAALGFAVLAHSLYSVVGAPPPLGWLAFAALAIATGWFKLNFAAVSASIFVSDTFFIAIAALFGPAPAAVAVALDSTIICLRRGDPCRRLAFNAAAPALSLWIASRTCFAVAGVAPVARDGTPVGALALPILTLALVYFVLNSGLTATAIALDARQSPLSIWRRHFMWLSVGYLAAASAAFCLILLIQQVSLTAAVMVLPLVAVFYLTLRNSFGRLEDAQRHLKDLDRLYLSTVETLAMAIDAKDDVTSSHVRRVQAYAVGLARALGVEDESTIKAIEAAALLHDTGKLAVPEHILNKPGKLTDSEFEKMKLHVDVGADILSLVDFPYPVVPIVRCHHENWDGSGYPRGIAGGDIPIGARILSVVDCFDALTSDRPYRRRMTEEAALDVLRGRRGTMYDPRVVDAFLAVHREIEVHGVAAPERDILRRITESRLEAAPHDDPASATGVAATASADLLAFVSLARLAAGEGSVGDVLSMSSTLIGTIVPNATGAWYLPDQGRVQLTAAEAFGPSASIVRGMAIPVGQRITGWAAASRQPIVNSEAALDLGVAADEAAPPLRSGSSVPLFCGETLVAVLSLYSPDVDAFDQNSVRLLQMIAPHVANALHAAGRHAAAAKEAAPPAMKATGTAGRDLRLVSTR